MTLFETGRLDEADGGQVVLLERGKEVVRVVLMIGRVGLSDIRDRRGPRMSQVLRVE